MWSIYLNVIPHCKKDQNETSIVTSLEDHQISLNLTDYPNPTTNYLTLNVGNFQLFDIGGKLIENKKIASITEIIRMENLTSVTYF
jgi:hypothetical protein